MTWHILSRNSTGGVFTGITVAADEESPGNFWGKIATVSAKGRTKEETEKLARLISATPELLAALDSLVKQASSVKGTQGKCLRTWLNDELRTAHEIIAKVEGK